MHDETENLYDFYNGQLKRFGIGEGVETAAQLSQMQRVSAAMEGVGTPLLAFWLLGRKRAGKAAEERAA